MEDVVEITNANYFNPFSQMAYFGASQFKSFLDCEARTMAELNGDWQQEPTKSMLIGSYIDAAFSGESDEFVSQHQDEMFNKRTGELKADYRKAEEMLKRAHADEMFMRYMSGEPQKVMTGELFGQPFKIKMDSYHPGKMIVDLKCMRDMKPIFKDGEWQTFIKAWGYDIQMYIYQQIEAQNSKTGKLLPCYLAVITKEEEPDIQIIELPQYLLDGVAPIVEHYIKHFAQVKAGVVPPKRCECCAYCKRTKQLVRPMKYEDLLEVL